MEVAIKCSVCGTCTKQARCSESGVILCGSCAIELLYELGKISCIVSQINLTKQLPFNDEVIHIKFNRKKLFLIRSQAIQYLIEKYEYGIIEDEVRIQIG